MKFANLLTGDDRWAIVHRTGLFAQAQLRSYLCRARAALAPFDANLREGGYLVVTGSGSLDYFLFTLLASAFGYRIVLADAKMLGTVLGDYQLNVVAVLSTRALPVLSHPVVVLSNSSPNVDSDEVDDLDKHLSPRSAGIVFMTSGTTSVPKMVLYDESQLVENALAVGRYLGIAPGDRVLCMFPTHYMYGFSTLMNGLLGGATVVLERPSITAHEVFRYVADKSLRFAPLIRSLIEKVCDIAEQTPGTRLDHLVVLNASDRIYSEHVARLLKLGALFWNNFGQTESGPRIFALRLGPDDLPSLASYCFNDVVAPGRPIDPRIEIEVVDARGEPCEAGKPGYLRYRTPFSMQGYLMPNGDVKRLATIESGDVVIRREDGLVFWIGRKDETIKCNGKLINVGLLHQHFDTLAGVAKSYFLIDPHTGTVTAFVRPDEAVAHDCDELKTRFLNCYRTSFPLYPRVEDVIFVDDLPVTTTGKVSLKQLRTSLHQ